MLNPHTAAGPTGLTIRTYSVNPWGHAEVPAVWCGRLRSHGMGQGDRPIGRHGSGGTTPWGLWSRLPVGLSGSGFQGRNRSRAAPSGGVPPLWAQASR